MSNANLRIQIYKLTRQLISRRFKGELPMPVVILNVNDPNLYKSSEGQISEYMVGYYSIIFPVDFDFNNRKNLDSFILHHLRFIEASIK